MKKSVHHNLLPGLIIAVVTFLLTLTFLNLYFAHPIKKTSTSSATSSADIISSSSAQKESKALEIVSEPKYSGFCLNVPILLYHHIQPESLAKTAGQTSLTVDNGIFDQQMVYLSSHGYTTITAKQLIEAIRSHSQLASKSILVTIDDGYKDAFTYAFPILQKYHITANFMIPTGLIGGADYMSWGDLEEMGRSGIAYFVDHTWSHYAVSRGPEDKIRSEILTAKQQLEKHLGQKVDIFAYPYGTSDSVSIKILQENGFLGAFSTIAGFYQCDSFIMNLHRNRIGNSSLSSYGL